MNLEEYLIEYKALTLDMMERIDIDDSILYLMEEREIVLDSISKIDFDQSELKEISDRLNLVQLEKELNLLIKKETVSTKRKIENLKKMKNANLKYTAIGYVPPRFNKEM